MGWRETWVSGTAVEVSGAALLGSGTAVEGSGMALLGSGTAVKGSGAAPTFRTISVKWGFGIAI